MKDKIISLVLILGAAGFLGFGEAAKADEAEVKKTGEADRDAAQQAQSMGNMKQLMLGILFYENAHKSFPAHASYSADGKPLLSWRVLILPYLEEKSLYNEFHLDEPWDSPHNKPLVSRMPAVFKNPNLPQFEGKTNYLAVVGPECVLDGTADGMPIKKITDGTSRTVMLVEANADRAIEWTKPDDFEYDAKNPSAGLGGLRPGGWNAAWGDGHVSLIRNGVDPQMIKAVFTRAGGETVDPNNL